ncbi:hypothetical protein RYX36_022674, partial [Vicia faba]
MRIYSAFPRKDSPMYEFTFREEGMCLPFMDFQDRFYVVKPISEAVVGHLYDRSVKTEDGREQWKHFEQKLRYYLIKPEELYVQDKVAYDKLEAYVKSFSPAKCMGIDNSFILDDAG